MNLILTTDKKEKIEKYLRLLISSKHNLTAIKDLSEAYQKHFLDVALPLSNILLEGDFIDIGTGGGVPGVLCAILFPDSRWTLLDSVRKKVQEVERFVNELGLTNVRVLHQRVEEHAKTCKCGYDGAFLRAVTRADICLEYAAPLLRMNGKVYLYKGPSWQNEKSFADIAAELLGLSFEQTIRYQLEDGSNRNLIIYKKIKETPVKYPRRVGLALKRPLGGN
ncbi:16S rRNA (guanine(527)-N(7))-methyltransferase RsmG [Kosmotoga pacifica]|uniref:Ribosomal RNA small subunit methyltransferase G n=1 Tax=Kosmotoga pacifica TaxID=1330330 RepID=A0A0G2ZC24_9BACT|nr:16S rRNA (guanine(527)-N(7))-methyltransferase RsmG [Kosmotoga pacifica]AKI97114.1 hypothetical protein IX53_03975 [Kosmotoga pacifica]